ncbi:hypothetical protein Leryth_002254 [Lithospermum erythrorhizon]|nr:hypothetical protein Leryth_002254 [Lithospermum erythrorhizon]
MQKLSKLYHPTLDQVLASESIHKDKVYKIKEMGPYHGIGTLYILCKSRMDQRPKQ